MRRQALVAAALWAAVAAGAACGKQPSGAPGSSAMAAAAASPAPARAEAAAAPAAAAPAGGPRSDAIVFRFQDHLAEAEISGPDPARALAGLGARTRALVNPHGRAPARRAFYLAELAFDRGRVADLLPEEKWPGDGPDHRGAPGGGGPMGGPAGVVDLRGGLLAPAGTTFTWKLSVPQGAYLSFDLGVAKARPGLPVRARVDVDGTTVWSRTVGFAEGGQWHPVEVDLAAYAGRTVTLTLATTAERPAAAAGAAPRPGAPTAIGPALFGDPLLLQRGGFDRPNIVVIALDAVRADMVGAYGSDLGLTPNIDALAAEGTAFTQAIIPVTWTRPSVIGMLGGCYPHQMGTGTEWTISQPRREQFYRGRPPLATLGLRRAGYQTFTMGNAILFVGYSPLGLDLGWDGATDIRDIGEETAATTRSVLHFLKGHRQKPFFLYVHLDTAHLPYNPPKRLLDKVMAGPGAKRYTHPNARGYLGEVAFADEQVGRIKQALVQLGLAERTVFIITADHGETIEREKYVVYPKTGRNTIWGHGSTPFDNVLRVPLVLWKPGLIPAGKKIEEQVRTLDVAPSLLELAGAPPDPRHCGRSVGNLVRGEPDPGPRVALSYSFYSTMVRAAGWKLLVWHGEAAATRLLQGTTRTGKMLELYHVAVDPQERDELSLKQPGELRRMRALYAEAVREAARLVPRETAAAATPTAVAAVAPGPASGPAAAAPAPAPEGTAAAGPALVHLRLTPDGMPHRFEARVRSAQPVAVRGLTGQVRVRGAAGGVTLEADGVRGPVEIALEIDLAAGAQIEATVDGQPLPAERILVGRFALALLAGPRLQLDRTTWDAIRARSAPPRDDPGVYVWGEGGAGAAPTVAAGAAVEDSGPVVTPVGGDVTKILKGWGYIQGNEKAK
ncbi:MAG TPA: sulfatase [Polyangia bacterium]